MPVLQPSESLRILDAKTAPYPPSRGVGRGRRRIFGDASLSGAVYHAMSRTCAGTPFFDETEKEGLVKLLQKMGHFFGVELLTYCVMGNHFHVLARIPHKDTWMAQFEGPLGETKLIQHLSTFYSKAFIARLEGELNALAATGQTQRRIARLNDFKRRFCDLSIFIKESKERFSRWYNKRHDRKGTLWMDRFKSVLVESKPRDVAQCVDALREMALYIDLNPVRAGLVAEAADYRWSGYSAASKGNIPATAGIAKIVGTPDLHRALPTYRQWLAATIRCGSAPATLTHGLIDSTQHLPSLTCGGALGDEAFVATVFESLKPYYQRKRRGVVPLAKSPSGGLLCSLKRPPAG